MICCEYIISLKFMLFNRVNTFTGARQKTNNLQYICVCVKIGLQQCLYNLYCNLKL